MKIDLASETQKQDDDEEKYDHHAQPQQTLLPPKAQAQPDEVMNMLPMNISETAQEIEPRRTQLRNDFQAGSWKEQIQLHVRFIPKQPSQPSVRHQVSPSGECHFPQAQRTNTDKQRLIRVLIGSELPPNHLSFTSRFFQKLQKKRTKTCDS